GAPHLIDRLIAATTRNLRFYGFGMEGFALSMVGTALEVTDHRVPGPVTAEILSAGRASLTYPLETLPHVAPALAALERDYRLLLVTKGDIFDQERKLAASRLADYYAAIETFPDKSRAPYERIFARHTEGAAHSVMIGN